MRWLAAAALSIAAAAFTLSVVSIALVSAGDGGPAAAANGSAAPLPPQVLEVTLTEFAIQPSALTASAGSDVTLRVRNAGGTPHDLAVEGVGQTPMLNAGQQAELRLGRLEAGTYRILCAVPGHADLGMTATLVVGAAGGMAVGDDAHAGHGGRMTAEEMDASYMAGVEAYPAKTAGLGGQPLAPRIEDGVKVYELTASEFEWEVEPGDFRQAMGYNGVVPGPEIRVALGDRVRVVLHNELSESTAIHFHGLLLPNEMDGVPGLTQPLVKPGESFTYEFTVRNAGSHMYHSHMNGAHQIPAGLLGAFIVEGEDELEVDQDMVMILNDGPLGYSINGKGFPATQPIVAKQGERVRIRYMNEGLQIHPMHLHGMPQLVIARDGYPLPQPYLVDTILVAPGERVDVIVEATELGAWALHCHVLSHAENEAGMFGMVTVFVVQE
jgi:manganese oxidase